MVYEIMPRVWFGPAGVTFHPEEIAPFTHILNCSDRRAYTNTWAHAGRAVLYLESLDLDDFPLLERHFDRAVDFIDNALQNPDARVYIHCLMGLNRSACIAVAYTCLRGGGRLSTVLETLRKHEPHILSNTGFCQQLKAMFPEFRTSL